MPKPNSQDSAKEFADQYLKLLTDQKTLTSQIDELKQQMADYCQENNIHELVTGNTRLKVSQGERTVFPKPKSQAVGKLWT